MTIRMPLILPLVLSLFVFVALPGFPMAAEERFFEALYDVPVMPGMEEVPGQSMLFDKPDGRIAVVVAATKVAKPAEVSAFYDETLTQMGWKKVGVNQYLRGEQRLGIKIEGATRASVVNFTLEPRGATPAGK
ncbi:MAG: hypothetical protein DI626_04805 [Micavibrio aeruginosavorus]|uniref:Uncharacterized protein n=1 Tax=Micavibrio aeruginosavorus TaxID=349221 RepID=A0A2W5A134_9BACT|nr:MAG: hypothetical protein DI626_04805 [Micavibrio aeruginosavorus]